MKLEVGKFYRSGDGRTHGPMRIFRDRFSDDMGNWYGADGHYWQQRPGPLDLVEEVSQSQRGGGGMSGEGDAARAQAIVAPYRKQVSETPGLLSALYDLDLMPEQITRPINAARMVIICVMFGKLTPEAAASLFSEDE